MAGDSDESVTVVTKSAVYPWDSSSRSLAQLNSRVDPSSAPLVFIHRSFSARGNDGVFHVFTIKFWDFGVA